jgi:EKC/KEOPS complex subunit PCC1/LAGE3
MTTPLDPDFPCSMFVQSLTTLYKTPHFLTPTNRTISVPLPTARLASAALQTLRVDEELSPLVRRSFSTISPGPGTQGGETVLRTEYKATTNRMLRVAVNGFMESLGVVLGVMEELDVDVLGKD